MRRRQNRDRPPSYLCQLVRQEAQKGLLEAQQQVLQAQVQQPTALVPLSPRRTRAQYELQLAAGQTSQYQVVDSTTEATAKVFLNKGCTAHPTYPALIPLDTPPRPYMFSDRRIRVTGTPDPRAALLTQNEDRLHLPREAHVRLVAKRLAQFL